MPAKLKPVHPGEILRDKIRREVLPVKAVAAD